MYMSQAKKPEKRIAGDDTETSQDDTIPQFADMLSQNVLEKDMSQCESFEFYAHQLRSHLHANPELFKNRFAEGYRILLEELEKEPII